jgi:hypothetical protein
VAFTTSLLVFLIVYNAVILFCSKYNLPCTGYPKTQKKKRKETVVLFSALCFLILLLALAASFPGMSSPDTEDQWAQVQKFAFNDAHPAIHTLLIWLATRIINHYAFVVFVQITVFSIGVGYLIATLESWGFSIKILLVTGLLIILNPYTIGIMMFLWKDLALTILLLYATIMTVNIYYSKGAWFSNGINVVLFALITGLASIIRHNGFFFTVPLYLIIVFLYSGKNKKALVSLVLAALVVFLIKSPLYNTLKVKKPNNNYPESVGIPMTILSDVLVKNPQRLPQDAKSFLNKIASDEEWHEKYVPGNYNSAKWSFNPSGNLVKYVPPETLLKWVLQTCINARYEAFHAICEVTSTVWIMGRINGISLVFSGKGNIITRVLNFLFRGYIGLSLSLPVISLLFSNLGTLMLLLLIIGIFSLSRNGTNILLLVVPSVVYNLGTMLLLCGNDFRFFHFNFVMILPLLFVLLSKPV